MTSHLLALSSSGNALTCAQAVPLRCPGDSDFPLLGSKQYETAIEPTRRRRGNVHHPVLFGAVLFPFYAQLPLHAHVSYTLFIYISGCLPAWLSVSFSFRCLQRDPALFPESRVRPWVVDEKSERKVEKKNNFFSFFMPHGTARPKTT